MNKKYVILFVLSVAVVFAFSACSTTTPADPEATYGTISGNIVLPTDEAQNGMTWEVLVDTDLNHANGVTNIGLGTCGTNESVPYSITVAAGSYYVYAVVKTQSQLTYPPIAGDYVGVRGTDWPAYPASSNVTVVNGQTSSGTDINMVMASNNVYGTLTMPLNADGLDYLIMMDNDGDGSNGGVDYLDFQIVAGMSGTTYDYGALALFPGTWYIVAQVDVNTSGLPGNPAGGDYAGLTGPHVMDPTTINGPFDITLSTMP
jgi:hypothetical protein